MQHNRYPSLLTLIVCALSFADAPACHANLIFDVRFDDTSPLISETGETFSLDFQLNDGSAIGTIGDMNNRAILSNFNFGIGGSAGDPMSIKLEGGASGSLTSGITLNDSSFLNEFSQDFNPGSTLSFRVNLTTNVDIGPTPDAFSVGILDKDGAPLPTTGLGGAFLFVNITSSNPSIETFGTTPDSPISLSAPQVSNVVPDGGSSIGLLSLGLLGLGALRRKLQVSA